MLLFLLACAPKVPVAASEPTHPILLWRVEKEGRASHLFGTCHIGVDLDYALPKPHDLALTDARVVYTEADLNLADPARVVGLLWTDGPGLSERLPEDDWRAVAAAVRGTLPAPMIERMRPWALASMVPFATSPEGTATVAKKSMDVAVQERARARGIPQKHVETLEEQAAILGTLDESFLEKLGPVEPAEGKAATAAVSDLCFRGDVRVADAVTEPDDPASDVILGARNRAWVPKLLPDLQEGGVFVAVGAGHMLGDAGLVALLQGEGFTVTQLTTTRAPSDAELPNLAGHVPPAPPPSPALAAYEAQLPAALAGALCADGQVVRACFEPDAGRCVDRLTADTRLCVRQHADQLPADGSAPAPGITQQLAGCAPTGLILEAIANDGVGDGMMCRAIEDAIKAAAKQ